MSRILIVDDVASARDAASRLLASEGHEVITAENAWRALSVLEACPVDLVVLDLSLPGLDGFGFLDDVRRNPKWRNVRVVVMSGLQFCTEAYRQNTQLIRAWLAKGEASGAQLLDAVRGALPSQAA
jgi:CheY-like chemotaxis protein